tara:strand:+ start:31 stop:378 length:348 start_codon:yes stop_codon:yes gene_type:complete
MKAKRRFLHGKRRRRSPFKEDFWSKAKKDAPKIAPDQPTEESKEKYSPKQGSFAESFVDAVTPTTAADAVTMIMGGGVVSNLGKIGSKFYQGAKMAKRTKAGFGFLSNSPGVKTP